MRPLQISELVRPNEVSSKVYSDSDIFESEIQNVFGKAWILLGHECQIENRGDYFLGKVGLTSVIVARGKDEEVRVFINRCTHRGAQLCTERKGNKSLFICPYHNWTFDLTGKVRGLPLKSEYPEDFDWDARGLKEVKCEIYRGFIFASHDPVTDLRSFLGNTLTVFDDFVERSPVGELESVRIAERYRVRANWKMVIENMNDVLHVRGSHASCISAVATLENPEKLPLTTRQATLAATLEQMQKITSVLGPYGHSYLEPMLSEDALDPNDPYLRSLEDTYGPERAKELSVSSKDVMILYPSATVNPRFQTIRLIRPIAVDETEVVAILLRPKGTPDTFYENSKAYAIIAGSPASFIVVDDLEIYERAQAASETSEEIWQPMERLRDWSPENSIAGTSEAFIRGQFAAWREYME